MKAKPFVCILLCLLIMVSSPISASAVSSSDETIVSELESENIAELNDFIDYASVFFNDAGRFSAIDRLGTDVSEELFKAGTPLFSEQNWSQLNDIFEMLDVQYIVEKSISTLTRNDLSSNNSDRTYTVEDIQLFITDPEIVYSKQEFSTRMAAAYTVTSNNQIVDAYSLYLIPAEISGGVAPIYLRNVVLYAPDISGTRVTFSGSFSAYKDTVYCGHFTHEFTADSNGNIVD